MVFILYSGSTGSGSIGFPLFVVCVGELETKINRNYIIITSFMITNKIIKLHKHPGGELPVHRV